jgi:hypothetical protein
MQEARALSQPLPDMTHIHPTINPKGTCSAMPKIAMVRFIWMALGKGEKVRTETEVL